MKSYGQLLYEYNYANEEYKRLRDIRDRAIKHAIKVGYRSVAQLAKDFNMSHQQVSKIIKDSTKTK